MFNFKKKARSILLLGIAIAIGGGLQGCVHDVKKEKNQLLNETPAYKKRHQSTSKEAWLERLMDRNVEANFVNSTVFYAVSQVAKTIDIPIDTTFRPKSDARLTMNYKGTLGEFLSKVYYQTGIKYKYRTGMLKVFNRKEVERQFKVKTCRGGKPSVTIALDNTMPAQVFKHMSQKYNIDFTFDNRMVAFAPDRKKPFVGNVSFYYKGCDKKEALRKFAKAIDVSLQWTGKRRVTVRDYETAEVDIPTYFDYEFSSSGEGIGSSGGVGGGSGGGGSESGSRISKNDNFKEEFMTHFQKYLSETGVVNVSNRGYAVITDRPSRVAIIKKLVRIEKRRQTPIALSVAIIRVDVADKGDLGVDWSVALNTIANKMNLAGITAGISMAEKASGGGQLVFADKGAGAQSVVNALQTYGKSKIVRDFNSKTRSGILSTFKAVNQIPYVTSSIIVSDGVSQVSTEAKVAEAGLIVNIIPTITGSGEVVNLATNISVSEYKGDKVFNVNGGEYRLPEIATNSVQMPVRVKLGRSIVLTGFKLSKDRSINEGIPGASQVGGIFGGLFGHAGVENQDSEFLIVITPRRIKDF